MNLAALTQIPAIKKELDMLDRDFGQFLELLKSWVAQPSISLTGTGLFDMAGMVAHQWQTIGAQIERRFLDLNPPLVIARLDVGAPLTVLIYGMYDVMPADTKGWMVPPFSGEIQSLPGPGMCMVARGAYNSKGPLAGIWATIKAMLDTSGSLPVNVIVLMEGEEETGSRVLRKFLAEQGELLGKCDAAIFPEYNQYGQPPSLYLGFRGIVHGRIQCESGSWGGPSASTHSSNAPWIASPVWHLVHGLALLGSDRGDFFLQPEVDGLSVEDHRLLSVLAEKFDIETELRVRNTVRCAVKDSPQRLLERLITVVSLNISEIEAGLPNEKAVIPSRASACFELRLPYGLDPKVAVTALEQRLQTKGPEGMTVHIEDAFPAAKFTMTQLGVQALLRAYHNLGVEPHIWPLCPGAAPAYAFQRIGTNLVMGGLGEGGNAHGINEYATLDGMKRFAHSLCLWLHAFAQEPEPGERETEVV